MATFFEPFSHTITLIKLIDASVVLYRKIPQYESRQESISTSIIVEQKHKKENRRRKKEEKYELLLGSI